jgi:hypothetical protein
MIGYPGNSTPATTTQWSSATNFALHALVEPHLHPNGLYFEATSVSGTGTTGSTEPTWPDVVGGTVIDNPGADQIIWTCIGSNVNELAITLQEPVDGLDDVDAATVNSALSTIADFIEFIMKGVGWLDASNHWLEINTFEDSIVDTGSGSSFNAIALVGDGILEAAGFILEGEAGFSPMVAVSPLGTTVSTDTLLAETSGSGLIFSEACMVRVSIFAVMVGSPGTAPTVGIAMGGFTIAAAPMVNHGADGSGNTHYSFNGVFQKSASFVAAIYGTAGSGATIMGGTIEALV